jgi:putative transcriptional regulator
MDKSISEVVRKSAKRMGKAGVIDERKMHEFESLCIPEVRKYSPEEIVQIRTANNASQAAFAAFLNVSESTVQQWESERRKPQRISLKLLSLVERKGLDILL